MYESTRILLAATLAVLLSAGTASAQSGLFAPTDIGLRNGDFEMMMEAETTLYGDGAPEAGATANWENSKNGDHGTAKLVEIYEWQGLPCRKIQHIVHIVSQKDLKTITLDRCRVASGEWKIRF